MNVHVDECDINIIRCIFDMVFMMVAITDLKAPRSRE